jgi:hypothetical protein
MHCNTLQHTATHFNTPPNEVEKGIIPSLIASHKLQHITTRYNKLQHTATHVKTLQYTTADCNASSSDVGKGIFQILIASHTCNTL